MTTFYTPPEDAVITRQSIKNNMDNCAAQVNWIGHPDYVPVLAEAPVFGTVSHALYCKMIDGQSPLYVLQADAVRAELLRALRDDYGLRFDQEPSEAVHDLLKPDVDDFIALVQTGAHIWHREFWQQEKDKLNVVLKEQVLYMPLGETPDGRLVVLQGTPDAVTDEPKLWDWKTAARGWKFEKAQFTDQVTLYYALIAYNLGTMPLEAEFVVYNRQSEKIERYPTHRTEQQVGVAVKNAYYRGLQLWQVEQGIKLPATPVVTEYFKEKRGWYCSYKYCSAWNCCDLKYLNDSVDETQRREPKWKP